MKNTKRSISALLLFTIGIMGIQAQEVIPATGGNATGTGGSAAYSVGQIVYTTNSGTNGSVAQGVQQPYEISVVSGIEDGVTINLSFTAYPNPTTNFLTLKIDGEQKMLYTASLYDITGKLLESKKVEGNETSIDMKSYMPAIYLLKVTDGIKEVKTFKIIKTQ